MSIHYRQTRVEIDIDAIRHNAKQIQSKLPAGSSAMAVVKANAYGHGDILCTKTLIKSGFHIFAVSSLEEAIQLREAGITQEVFLLYGFDPNYAQEVFEYRLKPIISSQKELEAIAALVSDKNKEYSIHINVETGMGRLGFSSDQIDDLFKTLRRTPELKVEGMMTHLACADLENSEFTKSQMDQLAQFQNKLSELGYVIPFYHIANSALTIEGAPEDSHWIRPGLMLYGVYPHVRFKELIDLKPVMSLKSTIFQIRNCPEGMTLSYGATFTTPRDSQIAVIPIGYADGYPRLISNRGYVLIQGQKCQVVGRVCMDLTLVDVTDLDNPQVGDEVILMGNQGDEKIGAEDLAAWSDTISYEILCGISSRVTRIIKGL